MILHSKYQGSRQEGFKVFISKIYFSLCDQDMQRTETILTIIKEGHIMIISANFG